MSKGVVLGGYQISNALIAVLLVASTTGAGVATDSFSGVTDGFDMPLSGPSDNVTQNNQTDDSTDSSDSDSSDNQDSSDDSSDSSDSSDSDSDSSDSSDSDSSDSSDSEDDGGFLDDILGGDEQDSENQTDEQDNQNQDETQDNETDDTTDQVNETDPSGTENATAEITAFSDPRSSDFYSAYDTSSVPLVIEFSGENAEYEITLNGESYLTGQVSDTETVNQTIDLSETGEHQIEVEVSQNGEVSDSISRTFEIASDAIQETGFSKSTTVRTGSDATFRLVENGESVADATVYLGDQQAQTDQDGKITFSIPYQETVTLSTDYSGIDSETFNVTQEIPEPDITLTNPVDDETFDTPTGTSEDVTFEADVEISEDSGTASVMIDGSEAYTQDLSSGTNSISTTQALSGGTHNWQVDVDTPEYDVSSSSRSLTVNEVEVENGLSLQNNATAEEYNYVRLYDSGEPVEGTEITVNGDSIGTTDSNGEIGFEVPNAQEITVSASGYSDITRTVEEYEAEDAANINIIQPESDNTFNGYRTNITIGIQNRQQVDYEILLDGLTESSGGLNQYENLSYTDERVIENSGTHTIRVEIKNQTTGSLLKSSERDFETTQNMPQIDISLDSPQDTESISGYSGEFSFDLSSEVDYKYELILDGQVRRQANLIAGDFTYQQTEYIENSGTHTWEVRAIGQDTGKVFTSNQRSFETSQDLPVASITPYCPGKSACESVSGGEEAPLDFSIDTFDDSTSYKVYLKKGTSSPEVKEEETLSSSGQRRLETAPITFTSGSYEWWVEATNEDGDTMTSSSLSFDVSGEAPPASFTLDCPGQGKCGSVESGEDAKLDFSIETYDDSTSYKVYLKNGTSSPSIMDQDTLTSSGQRDLTTDPITFDSGSYEWWVGATDKNGESINSSSLNFEVN